MLYASLIGTLFGRLALYLSAMTWVSRLDDDDRIRIYLQSLLFPSMVCIIAGLTAGLIIEDIRISLVSALLANFAFDLYVLLDTVIDVWKTRNAQAHLQPTRVRR